MDNSEKEIPKNILIIKLSSLGDVIHALPVPPSLKTLYPLARISFLVNREYGDLLAENSTIDEVFLFDRRFKGRFFESFSAMIKLIKELRNRNFDLVIDLQGLLRSGLMAWFSRGKKIIGFKNAREGSHLFYHETVSVPDPHLHAVERYLLIPKSMGWTGTPRFIINLNEKDKAFVESFLGAEKAKTYLPIVAIQPMARWPTKQWSSRKFAKLGDLIQKSEACQLVFLGSKEEIPHVEEIVRLMEQLPIIATGKFTLKQLAAFLKRCSLLITNDSGPMHLGAALNVPILALFGATDFKRTGPFGFQGDLIYKNIPCRPCLKRTCLNRAYPMECMETISPEEVFQKIQQMEKI